MGLDIACRPCRAQLCRNFLAGFAKGNVAAASSEGTATDGTPCFQIKGKQLLVLDLARAVLI